MHIGYRRDIDGLRFIAVSSVVLFHAGLETMSGGFVGVDIFFVISGYLITCGLFKDADGQGISIARFYERRIKRIIPAYAAVIVATMLAGLFVLLPSQLADLGKSALAATLFVANIHFWTGAGYFAGDPLSHPLLHLWSLAVEEQFYIVWPVFVLLLYRMGLARWRVPLILAGIAVTLVASQLMLGYSAKTAFYMAPLRAWELLVGALLACGHWPRLKAGWMAHAIGALALALILVPMFTYTEASQFPGCAAAPCLGAALAIYRDERYPSFLARALSLRLPVFIGTISYSLYIWHWPILSLVWIAHGGQPSVPVRILLVAVMIGVATLSWRYIERPFRTGAPPAGRQDSARIGLAARAVAGTGRTLAFGGGVLACLALLTGGWLPPMACPNACRFRPPGSMPSHACPMSPTMAASLPRPFPAMPAAGALPRLTGSPGPKWYSGAIPLPDSTFPPSSIISAPPRKASSRWLPPDAARCPAPTSISAKGAPIIAASA
jgi:peptidoglycan/LPS O-acetylase OafA/YrhL